MMTFWAHIFGLNTIIFWFLENMQHHQDCCQHQAPYPWYLADSLSDCIRSFSNSYPRPSRWILKVRLFETVELETSKSQWNTRGSDSSRISVEVPTTLDISPTRCRIPFVPFPTPYYDKVDRCWRFVYSKRLIWRQVIADWTQGVVTVP